MNELLGCLERMFLILGGWVVIMTILWVVFGFIDTWKKRK